MFLNLIIFISSAFFIFSFLIFGCWHNDIACLVDETNGWDIYKACRARDKKGGQLFLFSNVNIHALFTQTQCRRSTLFLVKLCYS